MARRDQLRVQRTGTVINATSKEQESAVIKALVSTIDRLGIEFPMATFQHEKSWLLSAIVTRLRVHFPEVEFADVRPTSFIKPDGGILSIQDREANLHPVLVTEVKHQGTNDLRATEGLPRQAMGNAIERLGKNVIGFRSAFLSEGIMPFVCFGYGYDFSPASSIVDRVVTIAMFGPLNRVSVVNEGDDQQFNRGSFFFRNNEWSVDEMTDVMFDIASRSVHYYFARHGPDKFETR